MKVFFLLLLIALIPSTASAVTFTGHANSDFASSACINDPGGQDIWWGNADVGLQFSGFDLSRLCIVYDEPNDQLQIGIMTRSLTTGTDYISGDADRDGNPGGTGSALAQFPPAQDIANFGPQEFFTLVLDFDFAVNNGFSLAAGSSPANSLGDYGVFTPNSTKLVDASATTMYGGAAIAAAAGSAVFGSPTGPSSSAPHLEFNVANASTIAGFLSAADLTDPNIPIGLYFTMGSHSDGPIGDDAFPGSVGPRILYGLQPITVAHLKQTDADGDGVIDDVDLDDDNDGIPDLIELGLKDCDLNSDGVLSVSQDANGNGTFDAGEEGEILKCAAISTGGKEFVSAAAFTGGKYPDYDGDGTPDYLDTDSDNDGLPDGVEDANHNGVVDPGETDPHNPDTDGDGIIDSLESVSAPASPPSGDTGDSGNNEDDDGDKQPAPPPPSDTGSTHPEIPVSQEGEEDPSASLLDPDLTGYTQSQLHTSGAGLTSCSLVPNGPGARFDFLWCVPGLLLFSLLQRRRCNSPLPPLKIRGGGIALMVVLLFSSSAHALNVQRQRLTINGSGGIFQDDAQTMGRGRWSLGMGNNFTYRPFQTTTISGNTRVDNIADYFLTQDYTFAYGLTDWFDLGVNVQMNTMAKVEPFGSATGSTGFDMGDILFAAKFQFLNPVMDDSQFGVAVIPFVTVPTGNAGRYAGDSSVTGGLKILLDHYWGRTLGYANIGARFRERENFLNTTAAHELLYGFGVQHPVFPSQDIYLLGEIDGSTTFRKFASQETSSPVEFNGGIRKYWGGGRVATTLGGGVGIDAGYGSPRFRTALAIQYVPSTLHDRDGDGISDARDYCPIASSEGGTMGEKFGCPAAGSPRVIVKIVGDRILILRPINFVTGSAEIAGDSLEVVDQVAALFKATPELKRVLVEGHTDNIGGVPYNQRLSEARARSVVAALAARGVEIQRLTTRGWGLTKPLDTNATTEGMARNRRVEFHIIDMIKGPARANR